MGINFKLVFVFCLFFPLLFSFPVLAALPPEYVEEVKEGASEIVVGSVGGVQTRGPAFFNLHLESLEKSSGQLEAGDTIKVRFRYVSRDFVEDGGPPVYVNKGDRIKTWLKADPENKGCYRPVMGGYGVERLPPDDLESRRDGNIKARLIAFWTDFRLWLSSLLDGVFS